MKPFWRDDDHDLSIYLGDCYQVMAELEVGFDLVLTDPPWGIGHEYAEHDDKMTPEEYRAFLWPRLERAEGLVQNGLVFVWQAIRKCREWHELFPREWRIFAACKNFAGYTRSTVEFSWDPILFWPVGAPKQIRDGRHSDWFICNTAAWRDKLTAEFSCSRTLDVCEYLVGTFGSRVLDPFLGSGTTLIACLRKGASGVGIETSEQTCELAVRRLEAELAQGRLWEPRDLAPQERLID